MKIVNVQYDSTAERDNSVDRGGYTQLLLRISKLEHDAVLSEMLSVPLCGMVFYCQKTSVWQ